MSDLRELYQEVILDHGKRPRNVGRLSDANRQADGHNPLCGDKFRLYLRIDDGVLTKAAFEGSGCAISTASASLMTDMVCGMSTAAARDLSARFRGLVTGDDAAAEGLDKLEVFAGVREFPVRVKCATLPWHTLIAALDGAKSPVKTE